jgi:hypothetical protein
MFIFFKGRNLSIRKLRASLTFPCNETGIDNAAKDDVVSVKIEVSAILLALCCDLNSVTRAQN